MSAGEGQLYLGAMAATATALALPSAPRPVPVALAIAAAVAAGALWGSIPGVLKVRLNVNEVVTTLMLNFVALLITEYLVTNWLRDKTAYGAVSFVIPQRAWIPEIPGLPGATTGAVVAVAIAPLAWVALSGRNGARTCAPPASTCASPKPSASMRAVRS